MTVDELISKLQVLAWSGDGDLHVFVDGAALRSIGHSLIGMDLERIVELNSTGESLGPDGMARHA